MAKKKTFEEKVKAIMKTGKSRKAAERIAGAQVKKYGG